MLAPGRARPVEPRQLHYVPTARIAHSDLVAHSKPSQARGTAIQLSAYLPTVTQPDPDCGHGHEQGRHGRIFHGDDYPAHTVGKPVDLCGCKDDYEKNECYVIPAQF